FGFSHGQSGFGRRLMTLRVSRQAQTARDPGIRTRPGGRGVCGNGQRKLWMTTSRRCHLFPAIRARGCRRTARAARTLFGSTSDPHPYPGTKRVVSEEALAAPGPYFFPPVFTTPASEKILKS